MTEIYDDIIVSLAALLGCDLKLVQKHFDDLNIARAPDVTESKRLVDDNKTLAELDGLVFASSYGGSKLLKKF